MEKIVRLVPECDRDFEIARDGHCSPSRWWHFSPAKSAEVYRHDGEIDCTDREIWDAHIPLDPELSCQILSRDLPEDAHVSITYTSRKTNDSSCIYINGPGDSYEAEIVFNLAKQSSYFEYIKVQKQGHGIGRAIMRNNLEFLSLLGIKKMGLYAALGSGGFVHALNGFSPFSLWGLAPLWDSTVRKHVHERYRLIKPFLKQGERKEVEPYLRIVRPHHIWAIADAAINMQPRLKDVFDQANEAHSWREKINYHRLILAFVDRVTAAEKITLGAALLAGSKWHGYMDLTNATQMRRAENYGGGFKYIGFERV